MTTIAIEEIQRDLLGYLRQVEAGETLIITRDDRPVAELKPIPPAEPALRPFALCRGEFTAPDDLDDPLPGGILHSFEG